MRWRWQRRAEAQADEWLAPELARRTVVFNLKVACDLTFEVWLRPKVTRMNLLTHASALSIEDLLECTAPVSLRDRLSVKSAVKLYRLSKGAELRPPHSKLESAGA